MRFHRVVAFIRRIVEAFRHVKSGGRTTRTKARARAAAPPRRCRCCGQEVHHSSDWRDHIPDWRDQVRDR